MCEYTKGKMDYSVLDGTTTPATLFINHDGDELDIAVFERWEQDWAKKEMEANAKELRSRWNEYPDLKQQRDDLLAACEIGFAYMQAIGSGVPRPILDLQEDKEKVKAAIAKAKT